MRNSASCSEEKLGRVEINPSYPKKNKIYPLFLYNVNIRRLHHGYYDHGAGAPRDALRVSEAVKPIAV